MSVRALEVNVASVGLIPGDMLSWIIKRVARMGGDLDGGVPRPGEVLCFGVPDFTEMTGSAAGVDFATDHEPPLAVVVPVDAGAVNGDGAIRVAFGDLKSRGRCG